MRLYVSTFLTHSNQMGILPARYTGDNILNFQSAIDFLQVTNAEGLMVALDFKSALDSIYRITRAGLTI